MSLPDPNLAYRHLFDNIRARVVFHKLANVYGVVPQNRKEADAIMEMAGKARLLKEAQETQKVAGDATSPIFAASKGLDAQLAKFGYGDLSKQAEAREEELSIKHAAADFMTDPDIYNSVLSLKAAQAEAFRQQHGVGAAA